MKSQSFSPWTAGAIFALALAYSLISYLPIAAHANPSSTCYAATSTASSSPTYMTPGTSTTTLSITGTNCDAQLDSATLLVQLTASSSGATPTVLNWGIEYSQDGVDWYSNTTGELATTSPAFSASTLISGSWSFASSSLNGAPVLALNNYATRAISIKTPTRYVRVFFTLPAASKNGAVYAMLIGKRETQ